MKKLRCFILLGCFFACLLSSGASGSLAQAGNVKPQATPTPPDTKENKNQTVGDAQLKTDAPPGAAKTLDNASLTARAGIQTSQTLTLSLNDAIRKALESNNDIQVARDDVRYQEQQLRSLEGVYDPVLALTPNFARSSSTGSTASNNFRLNSSLNQQIPFGGGNYNVFFNSNQTGGNSQNGSSLNQTTNSTTFGTSSSTTYFSSTGVNFTQPLFRNFRVDATRRQIRIQRKRLQQTDADFRRQTIEIIAQVQRSYWDLVFALRDQQNRIANLNLARENLRQIEAKIAAGSEAPLARAEVATELANRESDLLLATQQVSTTENTLKTLLLRDPNSPEWAQPLVPVDQPVFNDEPIVMEDAIKDAVDNRPELRRLRLQNEINKIDIDFFKNQTKPRIDLVSSFSLSGLSLGNQTTPSGTLVPVISGDPNFSANAYLLRQLQLINSQLVNPALIEPVPQVSVQGLPGYLNGGTLQSLQNLFRSDAPNYSVGVTFEIPLRNRTAKANLAGARIQQQQTDAQLRSQEQTVISEVRNAVQAVETSRQRVLASRRARENAEIQLEGERKLFAVGRSTTFLLFQRENALTNARNAEIRSETDYSKALSDLQRTTSATFRLNGIEVDSPVNDK